MKAQFALAIRFSFLSRNSFDSLFGLIITRVHVQGFCVVLDGYDVIM
jgi:hypothetical protein